jgi:hypothetical protein
MAAEGTMFLSVIADSVKPMSVLETSIFRLLEALLRKPRQQ